MTEREPGGKPGAAGGQSLALVKALLELAEGDTVYADVYLRRAREVLGTTLTRAQYAALKGIERDIEDAVKLSRRSTMLQDWKQVESSAARAEQLRQKAIESSALRDLGRQVYDVVGVAVDPFSPGFDFLPGAERDRADLRDEIVDRLKIAARDDAASGAFYQGRRAYFAGLALESKRAAAAGAAKSRTLAETQQLAAQAAQRGDVGQLRRYAQEILELERNEAATAAAEGKEKKEKHETAAPAAYQCPVDLAAPFPDGVVERAHPLGLAVARTEPLPQAAPVHAFVAARVWSPDFETARSETEGAMRAEAAVDEAGFPADVAQPLKVLVGQFLRNPFVNSGGARYLPRFHAETVLVEDFPEDAAAPEGSALTKALGLDRRRGLARVQVDDALLEHGAEVVERLQLDPHELRLVCIPHDLYMRFGRDRGWGQRQQWTHFDGYQVLRNGELRGLAGGDVRYGGLNDLLSFGLTDQRDSVVTRFAVVRRARHVARWI